MRIAIIGLGEVGRCYAEALHHAGHDLSLCDARPSASAVQLAEARQLAIDTAIGRWLSACDWILSCVTGAHSLEVAHQCIDHARPGATVCDMTTASPDVKRGAATTALAAKLRYVDVAIMGAISLNRERTPLLVSGSGATEFAALMALVHANVRVIEGGKAGDAMALKILRSVFTKGMEALSVELLMAADKQGVREQLFEQLRDIDETPLRTFIEMLVSTHVVHAARRAHEVQDAAAELRKHGLASVVLPGVQDRFAATVHALERRPPGMPHPTVDEALAWLLEVAEP